MRTLKAKLGAFVAVLLLPSVASAAFCWDESFGNTLVLSLATSEGNRFSLYGYREVPGFICQGSTRFPVTAEATVVGSQVALGMQVHAVDPGICVSSRRLIKLDLSTLNGAGSFRNDEGFEGSVTLTLTSCPPGTEPAAPTREIQDIENRVVH